MGIRHGNYNLMDRISRGMCENVTKLHELDLRRLGRRANAECGLQEMLTDLRDRMMQKATLRKPLVFVRKAA
jgi:hypothetical protein